MIMYEQFKEGAEHAVRLAEPAAKKARSFAATILLMIITICVIALFISLCGWFIERSGLLLWFFNTFSHGDINSLKNS